MASTSNVDPMYRETMGHIEGLPSIRPVALDACHVWCLDNSVYTGKFEVNKWMKRIESLRRWYEKCLFITIPDVVGDCSATLAQFCIYRDMVKGLPVAFVSQDGISKQAEQIPWTSFDCLFVGGSDAHKLGWEGRWIIEEAKTRGKLVHVGRVNSRKRILKFWQADSWDGTTLSFAPSRVDLLHKAVLQARLIKQSKGLFDDLHSNVPSGNYSSQPV